MLNVENSAFITVIHYFGLNDKIIDSSHGNKKNIEIIPHVMTAKSALYLQKCDLKEQQKKVYRKHIQSDIHPALFELSVKSECYPTMMYLDCT